MLLYILLAGSYAGDSQFLFVGVAGATAALPTVSQGARPPRTPTLKDSEGVWSKFGIRSLSKKDEFYNLKRVIVERDISEEKIKNASGLKIDLPKFSLSHFFHFFAFQKSASAS